MKIMLLSISKNGSQINSHPIVKTRLTKQPFQIFHILTQNHHKQRKQQRKQITNLVVPTPYIKTKSNQFVMHHYLECVA